MRAKRDTLRSRSRKSSVDLSGGITRNDAAIIESGFPPLFTSVMSQLAMTTGTTVSMRVGNPPRIGFGDDGKPMAVKQKTGAAFLFKCLIPVDQHYLKLHSKDFPLGSVLEKHRPSELLADFKNIITTHEQAVQAELSADVDHSVIKEFGVSQLRVSLNEVLSDLQSYEPITPANIKDGKLTLYPKASVVAQNPDHFKGADTVANTAFVIDLTDQRAPEIGQEKLLEQLPAARSQMQRIQEPSWWPKELGDFAQVKSQSLPVSYAQRGQEANPEPFLILGGPNALGAKQNHQRPITGDVDLFWITPFVDSFVDDEKYQMIAGHKVIGPRTTFNISDGSIEEARQFKEMFLQLVDTMHEKMGMETPAFSAEEIIELDLAGLANMQGLTNPSEAAMIHMVNKLFGAQDINISQLILHGSEVFNPGKPSDIGPLLHILPDGERVLTHDEDELIQLVSQENYLQTYPIDVHPKWNMDKWAPIIQQKHLLQQEVSPKTQAAYKEYIGLHNALTAGKFSSPDINYLSVHADKIDARWDMATWQPVIKKLLAHDPTVPLQPETRQAYEAYQPDHSLKAKFQRFSESTLRKTQAFSAPNSPLAQRHASRRASLSEPERKNSISSSATDIRKVSSAFASFNKAMDAEKQKREDPSSSALNGPQTERKSLDSSKEKSEHDDSYDESNRGPTRLGATK